MFSWFKKSDVITTNLEKRRRLEGEIQILEKQEIVEFKRIVNLYAEKKSDASNTIDNQISALKMQIATLQNAKESAMDLIEQQKKVALDKVYNTYESKILAKRNEIIAVRNTIAITKNSNEEIMSDANGYSPNYAYQVISEQQDLKIREALKNTEPLEDVHETQDKLCEEIKKRDKTLSAVLKNKKKNSK